MYNNPNRNTRRTLVVGFDVVSKTYHHLPLADRERMILFYAACQDVRFVERGATTDVGDGLRVRLTPVGIAFQRQFVPGIERFRKCIAHIVVCLEEAHAKGWCLLA